MYVMDVSRGSMPSDGFRMQSMLNDLSENELRDIEVNENAKYIDEACDKGC